MPSSISSSEPLPGSDASGFRPRRWAAAWIGALMLTLAALAAWEGVWRERGFAPEVTDSRQLWAQQRDRVNGSPPPLPVAFLGASRSVYGIDPKTWRSHVPGHRPVMLAINGHFPIATLRDLALDERFSGLVICDVDSHSLLSRHWDMQQPWVDFYRRDWTPHWKLHRRLLTHVQRNLVLARPSLGVWPTFKRLWAGSNATYRPGYDSLLPNRAGELHFSRVDATVLATHFDAGVGRHLAATAIAPSPERWLDDLAPVESWVRAIRARGGDVVFVNMPVSGRLPELESEYMPRHLYWDAFARRPGIRALHYEDVPALGALALPDHSHVDVGDRPALTLALIQALDERGWLRNDTKVPDL